MAEYLFELLTEEIPAWMLPHPALEGALVNLLRTDFGMETTAEHPHFRIDYTPRRIVFVLHELPARQPDRQQEVKGPPKKAAYGPDGSPTQALHGFLKKNNAAVGDVVDGG